MKSVITFVFILILCSSKVCLEPLNSVKSNALLAYINLWRDLLHLNTENNREVKTKPGKDLIFEDAILTVPELIVKYGYPVEVHTVETGDGYLVDMHRIPNPNGIPVFVFHGITDSSGGWVILGPQKALAYILADQGYDVWLGNARGTRYSRKHRSLSTESREFWNFSFHEIGKYDIPACIDHITNTTGFSKIHYIGFSQGTTSFWIMCSQRPEYCNKIIVMNALAPVAFLPNTKSPVIRKLSLFVDKIEFLTTLVGLNEFLPNNAFFTLVGQAACRDEAVTQALCSITLFLIGGYNTDQLNTTSLPVVFGHIPAGAATKQFIHYGQLVNSGQFRQYDYGILRNIMKYGQIRPPSYDLSKVTAPVVLHYSSNDWLSVAQDINRLGNALPNLRAKHLVSDPKFTHFDYLFAIDAKTILYDRVIEVMREAENAL